MGVIAKPLINAKAAETAETTQYTAPTGTRTIIDKLTGTNTTGASLTLTVRLVPSGGSAGAGNLMVTKTLAASEAYTFPEVVGHVLGAGDFISTLASGAGVTIRASGREVS